MHQQPEYDDAEDVTYMPDGRVWVLCWNCGGEIFIGHDCGEDCCCCAYPEDNIVCDICDGAGGWYRKESV